MRRTIANIPHTRLRVSMAVLLFAIFVLPAAIGGLGFYWYAKSTVLDEVEHVLALVATHEVNQIDDWVGEREFDLSVVGRVASVNMAVSGARASEPGMSDSLQMILKRAIQFFGDRYQSLTVFDLDGELLAGPASALNARVLESIASGSTQVSLLRTKTDSAVLQVYVSIVPSGKPPQAVLQGIVPLAPLFGVLGRTLMIDGRALLYDASGRLLACSDADAHPPVTQSQFPREAMVPGERSIIITSTDDEGRALLGVVRRLPRLGWSVIIERDRERALAGLSQLRRVLWSVMAIVLILGGGVAVFVANATVRKLERRERELQTTHEQLITADRLASVGMMAASLAHEINNPLTTIKVLIHSLQDRVSPNKGLRSDVSIVLGEIDKIKSLVLRFLQFARPRDPEFTAVDLDETMTRIASLIRHQAQNQGVLIFEDYDHSVGHVWADAAQIGQVFLNILLNALDATPVGGEIHIDTALAKDDRAVVTIMNSGPGLPDEIKEKIFEPFFSTKATGTGLGLSIARTIVEKHRGQVQAQGHGENGTTFTIVLRRAEGEAAHAAPRSHR